MSEQNDNSTDSQSSSSTKPVSENLKSWLKKNWLDGIDKLSPLLIAIGTALGGWWLANNIQDKLSAANLLAQREQAETSLRATMFNNLMDRIVTKDQQKPETGKMLLLAELLALNFDEHFQFKPLLIDLEKQLKNEQLELKARQNQYSKLQQVKAQQFELESSARRIIDRQTDLLRAIVTTQGDEYQQDHGKVQDIFTSDLFFKKGDGTPIPLSYGCNSIDASSFGNLDLSVLKDVQNKLTNEGWVNTQQQPASFTKQGPSQCITVVSPDAKTSPDSAYLLDISVLDFKEKTVIVSVNVTGTKLRSTSMVYEFEVTPYDFPLTDNTAIDADHRFAIVQEDVDVKEGKIWLRLIWFPKGYITERERPINYSDMRELLKTKKVK